MLVQGVNFFGHAAVASWRSDASGVALGAMLPDFETMSGARMTRTEDADVTAGILLHHATDRAFHTMPVVTGLMRELDELLAARDCARGPRRAVAHIGVELLLDGVLVEEPAYREAYTRAIAHEARFAWRDEGDDARFATLQSRLRAHGVPDDLREPGAIASRMRRMLSHRPLLAPSSTDMVAIEGALVLHRTRVEVAAETVLRGLRAAL